MEATRAATAVAAVAAVAAGLAVWAAQVGLAASNRRGLEDSAVEAAAVAVVDRAALATGLESAARVAMVELVVPEQVGLRDSTAATGAAVVLLVAQAVTAVPEEILDRGSVGRERLATEAVGDPVVAEE